jgi:hypothetical protein
MALAAGAVGLVEAGLEDQRDLGVGGDLLEAPGVGDGEVSDSTTQGPAIKTSGAPPPMGIPATEPGGSRLTRTRLRPCSRAAPMKLANSGCGLERLGLELGVELAADEPRVIGQLHDLDQGLIGRGPEAQAGLLEALPVFVVDLVAVPVTLADLAPAP